MKFETVEIEDLGKVDGVVAATLHFHEDKEVFLKIIDESPDSKGGEADYNDLDVDLHKAGLSYSHRQNAITVLQSKYIITKKQ